MSFKKCMLIPLITFVSCKNENRQDVAGEIRASEAQATLTNQRISVKWKELKDTTLNGVQLSFIRVNEIEFDSLSKLGIESPIPQDTIDDLVSKRENIQVIKLRNGKTDSLRDTRSTSGYFEEYEIKQFWKTKDQLLIGYLTWEGGGDFFINLLDGSHYNLNSTYKLSPNKDFILGFNSTIEIEGNDFMLSDISEQKIKTLFNIDFGQIVVTDLLWLEESKCLISSDIIEPTNFEKMGKLYYLMTIRLEK